MLRKLLKYDLKNMYKFLSFFYILSILFSITTRVLFSLKQTVIINVLGQISVGCMFAMVANIIINIIMRNWIRFNETLYKDESYLTHTLPVKKETLYISKFLLSMINLLTSFVVILITLFIAYYTKDRFDLLKYIINDISSDFSINMYVFIILIILILFLELYQAIQSGFLGIIIGNRKNNNKTLYSVVFGLVTYFVSQMVVLLSVFIVGIFNKDIMNMFTSNVISNNVLKVAIVLSIVIYLLIIIIEKFVAEKLLKQGVNID